MMIPIGTNPRGLKTLAINHLRGFGIGFKQFAVLEHLAATAQRQRAEARYSHTKWRGGWTYLRYNRTLRPTSVMGLIKKGLIQPCCSAHGPYDSVRISRAGVELLEKILGEEILA